MKNYKKLFLKIQKNEITEYFIYSKLAEKNSTNREILLKIAQDELKHYKYLKSLTGKDIKENKIIVYFYVLLAKIFGLSFGLKLMESGEKLSAKTYNSLKEKNTNFSDIFLQEQTHEKELLKMIEDKKLKYTGSLILGLNDSLVELTGVLAGLTLSLQNTRIIGFVAFITGFAASLSMAASEYLSSKEEEKENPLKSAIITGIAYIVTVLILISPYILFDLKSLFTPLIISLILAVFIIAFVNFYISTVKEINFKKRFLEMLAISFTIAIINFFIGFFIKKFIPEI